MADDKHAEVGLHCLLYLSVTRSLGKHPTNKSFSHEFFSTMTVKESDTTRKGYGFKRDIACSLVLITKCG